MIEVKREAKVGERIRIVDAKVTFGDYKNGDEMVVADITWSGVKVESYGVTAGVDLVYHEEYVVLEEGNTND